MREISFSYPTKFGQDRKYPTIEARITIKNPNKTLVVVYSLDDVFGIEKMNQKQISALIQDFKDNMKNIPYLLDIENGLYNIDNANFIAIEFNNVPIFK